MKKILPFLLLCLVASAVMVAAYDNVYGFPFGIVGYSGMTVNTCNNCHSGGIVPDVNIEGPVEVATGSTRTYTLIISGGQEIAGGLDVAVTEGLLAAISADTQLLSDEITHTDPKLADVDGAVSFSFQWTAPVTPTAVTMYGAGNSVNLLEGNQGDAAATTTLSIAVLELNEKVYLPVVTR